MSTPKSAAQVTITISGPNKPELAAQVLRVLAEAEDELLDIHQAVVGDQLTLGLVAAASPALVEALTGVAAEMGASLHSSDAPAVGAERYVLTLTGSPLQPAHLHALTSALAEHACGVTKITRLSQDTSRALELALDVPQGSDFALLKANLLELAKAQGFDVALQREGFVRRNKRLLVLDMDSTLIPLEFIDEIAKMHGVSEQVSAVTERAMQGEMDYDESLRQRLGLLKGLEISKVEERAASLPLTEGAETLIRVLRRLGYRTAVLSGGFSVATETLKKRLHLDHAHSNVLEVEDGKLTGRVVGPVVNGARKAVLLKSIAEAEGISLGQVMAVGDGANDIDMLGCAGLGIAFHAKAKLRAAADASFSSGGLDSILYLLGISDAERDEVMKLA
ncbi:MAG: phosphoserine phosphatase SerB [Polyangiales bacterium]